LITGTFVENFWSFDRILAVFYVEATITRLMARLHDASMPSS